MNSTLRRTVRTALEMFHKTINRTGMVFLMFHYAHGLIRFYEISPWVAYSAFFTAFSVALYDLFQETLFPRATVRLCFLTACVLTLLSMMNMPNDWSKANEIFVVLVWSIVFTKARMQ